MRNTWVTNPLIWDNSGKPGLIPDETYRFSDLYEKATQGVSGDGPAAHQVVGEVKAHQAEDG